MSDTSEKILEAICEMRDLIRIMAEPQIAIRDKKLREELLRIAGRSAPKQKAVMLMDGKHTQSDIHKKTGMHRGQLSTFVKQLGKSSLLIGEAKTPKLAISVPANIFESK